MLFVEFIKGGIIKMELKVEINTKEDAEKLIKQLQEFVETKESLYPDVNYH